MASESTLDIAHICSAMFAEKPDVPAANWVAYENGTVVMLTQEQANTKEDLILRANEAVGVQVYVGTPSADMNIARLDVYFPDEPIYAVLYSDPDNMLTIIVSDSDNELQIALLGREQRKLDCERKKIVATSKD
ncbi:hypothetical protein BGW37DRAFT_479514 [Umbelopsis sp. PMI_123]|nr:hypothetical protein BGW37DRAFT_479514 [Umbelopsis sp. PMI_123]